MKKNYALLGILSMGVLLGFSQDKISTSLKVDHEKKTFTDKFDILDKNDFKKTRNNKVFGDTLFYEDFAGGVPTGWTVVNNNANNFQWQWTNMAQNGQFTTGFNPILSTTSANGFMSLPSDFYNSPIPPTGAVSMDTYFQSDTITIPPTGAVWVSYQQWLLYCCLDASLTGTVRLLLQVSTDNFATTTDFLANDGLPSNTIAVGNATAVTNNTINITSALNGATDFQIRFLAEGNDAYFWYIDDFAVIEGAANDLQMSDEYLEFYVDGNAFNPIFGQTPYALFPALPFSAQIRNNGSNTATKARIDVDVTHNSLPGGTTGGTGLVYSTASPDTTLPFDSALVALTQVPRFVPQILGSFTVDFTANMDSVDQVPTDNTASLPFFTTDTVLGTDDQAFGGGTGTGAYVRGGSPGGTAVGDRFATKYVFEPNRPLSALQRRPTSITYAVSDDVTNIGVEIIPSIWEFYEDSLFSPTVTSLDQCVGPKVASSFIPYTVTPNDTNSFLTLALDNGTAFTNGLDSGMQYLVGFEVTSIAGGTNFEVRNDFTTSQLQPAFQTFLWFGHSPGWGTGGVNPVMRLNLANLPLPTGISSNTSIGEATFNVSPNPNNGEFSLKITTEVATTYNVNIRNVVGQVVYQDIISVNGAYNEQIDLSTFEKGMYFVSLENDSEKHLKKVVIK